MPDHPKQPAAAEQSAQDIFADVCGVIEQRKQAAPNQSYVARLLASGPAAINAKILEEAHEVCQAGLADNPPGPPDHPHHPHLTHEICDLLFHTFVLAAFRGVNLGDIRAEFQRRFGTSGLVEKARRPKS